MVRLRFPKRTDRPHDGVVTTASANFTAQAGWELPAKGADRLVFFDTLKMVLVILVVAHHAAQPYGPTGGEWPLAHAMRARMLGPFFHVNASFFMGLFFLISAYFLPAAYDRKGAKRLLVDRVVRFGSVLLACQFALFPALIWALRSEGLSFSAYWVREIVERKNIEFAHLWFLSHLLVCVAGYVLWRRLSSPLAEARTLRPFPSNLAIAAYAAALSLVSALVRIWFPIDRWVFIGVPAEIAHLPQYCSLFVIGVLAYRFRWLPGIPERTGRLWLGIGVALAAFRYAYTAFDWRFMRGSLRWTTWEAFLAIGMCIGSIWLFREFAAGDSALRRFLNRNAYGVYLVHLPIVVVAQAALEGSGYGPLTLTALSTVVTVAASYALTAGLRLIPGSPRIL